MDEAKLKQLKADAANSGRELVAFKSKTAEVVFRVPNGVEMDAYRTRHGSDRAKIPEANKGLLATCLAYPDSETFQQILNERPLLLEKWSDKLTDAAGADEVIEVKKL